MKKLMKFGEKILALFICQYFHLFKEAEVNEACMIYAVELSLPRAAFQLKNKKKGTFRREETKFTNAQEMELGVYNLWCAWKVFEHRRNIPVNYRHFPESRHHQY